MPTDLGTNIRNKYAKYLAKNNILFNNPNTENYALSVITGGCESKNSLIAQAYNNLITGGITGGRTVLPHQYFGSTNNEAYFPKIPKHNVSGDISQHVIRPAYASNFSGGDQPNKNNFFFNREELKYMLKAGGTDTKLSNFNIAEFQANINSQIMNLGHRLAGRTNTKADVKKSLRGMNLKSP